MQPSYTAGRVSLALTMRSRRFKRKCWFSWEALTIEVPGDLAKEVYPFQSLFLNKAQSVSAGE